MKKSHIAILSVIILVASASAAVNIRDPMNVFGNIDMQNEFKITNLANPTNPQDAATKNYVDNNAGSGSGGLNWDNAYDVAEVNEGGDPTASVSCEQDEILVSATCSISAGFQFDSVAQRMEPRKCDQRTRTSVSITTSEPAAAVEGTCVPGSSSSTDGGSDDTSSNQGIGQVDIIEEDGTLGPYKYCSISRVEDTTGNTIFDQSCTVSRNSDGVWSKSSNGGACHAACFGLDTKTETVTVSAKGQSGGNIQTISLGREYPNVIKAEWTGPGIQPTRGDNGPSEVQAEWRLSLVNTQTNNQHRIVQTGSILDDGFQGIEPEYFAKDPGAEFQSLNPVAPGGFLQSSYTTRFSQVTVDSVKLNAGGYNNLIFNDPNPETIYWTGSEELKITYIPND